MLLREITAADAQISGKVPKDVGHLEPLAEPDPPSLHLGDVPCPEGGTVGHVYLGPEFPDASRDKIRVPVEVVPGLQRNEAAVFLSGKGREIHLHALGDGQDEISDPRPVCGIQPPVDRKTLLESGEEFSLFRDLLRTGQRLFDLADTTRAVLLNLRSKQLQVREALVPADQPGVSDGVGGTGEEVGEAHWAPEIFGQDLQAEKKGPADALQDLTEEFRFCFSHVLYTCPCLVLRTVNCERLDSARRSLR